MTGTVERGLQVFSELRGVKAAEGLAAAMASGEFGADTTSLASEERSL